MIGIIHSMKLRSESLCSDTHDSKKENKHIHQSFQKNGYPTQIITKAMNKKTRQQNNNLQYLSTLVIPYSGTLSEQIKRICHKYNIRCVSKSGDTIKERLNKVAPRRSKNTQQGVIYQIPLSPCGKVYIGETGRTLNTRLCEHKSALKNLSAERSGVAEHCLTCLCTPNFEDAKILAKEENNYKRKIRETVEMEKAGPINIGTKSIEIGRTWNMAFLKRRCP
jgi:hypothetical protein